MNDAFNRNPEGRDAGACLILAKKLMRGRGAARNYEAAARWFDLAAQAGSTDAFYWLGKLYLKGLGVPKDPGGAASCFEHAANQGHAAAQWYLGECFEKGKGVPRSCELAGYWYRKSAARGEERAFAALLRLAGKGPEMISCPRSDH